MFKKWNKKDQSVSGLKTGSNKCCTFIFQKWVFNNGKSMFKDQKTQIYVAS
jgi:hypothetical protein